MMSDDMPDLIARAAARLKAGGLVAFPTETVYGLGADATNPAAVANIFKAKGRPSNNPLIVHVADAAIAQRYVTTWPEAASRLSSILWPGPLTLVLPKHPSITDNTTADGPTVALRVPDHPIALALLKQFDGPVAAPSANKSNHISPTTAAHVRDAFGDDVAMILDGGPCAVGIESTVLDLTRDVPRILRPGHITAAQIATILGRPVEDAQPNTPPAARGLASPGQLPFHYAPHTPAYRYEPRDYNDLDLDNAAALPLSLDPDAYARHLYARLRLLDSQSLRAIYIELPPDVPEWRAVRDRVWRATRPISLAPPRDRR